jgi:hypothetical protein
MVTSPVLLSSFKGGAGMLDEGVCVSEEGSEATGSGIVLLLPESFGGLNGGIEGRDV